MNLLIQRKFIRFSSILDLLEIMRSENRMPGYWSVEISSNSLVKGVKLLPWQIGTCHQNIIWSGTSQISSVEFVKTIFRYTNKRDSKTIETLLVRFEQLPALPELLDIMLAILDLNQVLYSLKSRILSELDIYSSVKNFSGSCYFVADKNLGTQFPIMGIPIHEIAADFENRLLLWKKLRNFIPALNSVPFLSQFQLAESGYSISEKRRIEALFDVPNASINDMAVEQRKDLLEMAILISKLVRSDLVDFRNQQDLPEKKLVMVIDDSIIMLNRFDRLIKDFGYSLITCDDPVKAIAQISAFKPVVIFIDKNMPNISGFELIRKIKKNNAFKRIKLILISEEDSGLDRQRSEWSTCEFLLKPTSIESAINFKNDVRRIILESTISDID
jgi:CheY-like chemotaxis protein